MDLSLPSFISSIFIFISIRLFYFHFHTCCAHAHTHVVMFMAGEVLIFVKWLLVIAQAATLREKFLLKGLKENMVSYHSICTY